MSFNTRQGLGGHASKKHPGQSESYIAKLTRRSQRHNDRLVLKIAKDLHKVLTEDPGSLDPLTASLFRRQRKPRKTKSEDDPSKKKGQNAKGSKGDQTASKKMSERDRGRLRRLKEKIWLLMNRTNNFTLPLDNQSGPTAMQNALQALQNAQTNLAMRP